MKIFGKIEKSIRCITVLELSAAAIAFAVMVICYFISAVNRNIIKLSVPWTEELALYCMVYMALLGMEVGLRDGTQVSVTALTAKLQGKMAGKVIEIIARLVVIFFSFVMLRYGYALFAKQIQTGQTSPVMKIPMFALYFSLVLSFGITVITQSLIFIGTIFHIPTEGIEQIDPFIDNLFVQPKKGEH